MPPSDGTQRTAANPPSNETVDRIARQVDRVVSWIARHWLAIFSTIVGLFVAVPFLAPVLTHMGAVGGCEPCGTAGRLIYLVYSPTCHQLPERSYFLFGPQGTYTVQELENAGAIPAGLNILQRELLRTPGAVDVGFKVALCERDVAIFGSLLLGGLIYGAVRSLLRRRGREVPRLHVLVYLACLIPMVLDGGTQLFGLRESDWLLRTITGALFGFATVWMAYPHIDAAMVDTSLAGRQREAGGAKTGAQTGQE